MRACKVSICLIVMVSVVMGIGIAWAGSVTIPNSFVANTTAVANEVNANFDAVKVAVDDNDSRITALEATVNNLRTDLTDAENRISTLESELATAQSDISNLQTQIVNLVPLGQYVSVNTNTINGLAGPHVIFTGANVHIRSGSGQTNDDDNPLGLGNLIIGYNEERTTPVVGRGGSHNLVVGPAHEYSSTGGLVAGYGNTVSNYYSSASGGAGNIASGEYSSASVGLANIASGQYSSVSGGKNNIASGVYSSVSGGSTNSTLAASASVSGGEYNTASGTYSSVSAGCNNIASGLYSSVSGGGYVSTEYGNTASGKYSSVSGGIGNIADGLYSSVSGGSTNEALATSASVSGGSWNTVEATANDGSISGGWNRHVAGSGDWAAGSLWEDY